MENVQHFCCRSTTERRKIHCSTPQTSMAPCSSSSGLALPLCSRSPFVARRRRPRGMSHGGVAFLGAPEQQPWSSGSFTLLFALSESLGPSCSTSILLSTLLCCSCDSVTSKMQFLMTTKDHNFVFFSLASSAGAVSTVPVRGDISSYGADPAMWHTCKCCELAELLCRSQLCLWLFYHNAMQLTLGTDQLSHCNVTCLTRGLHTASTAIVCRPVTAWARTAHSGLDTPAMICSQLGCLSCWHGAFNQTHLLLWAGVFWT